MPDFSLGGEKGFGMSPQSIPRFALLLAALLLAGCTSSRTSVPVRTAAEQLLISRAADQAATQLSLNQTALQAALQVTSTLNHLTLLNYLGPVSAGG